MKRLSILSAILFLPLISLKAQNKALDSSHSSGNYKHQNERSMDNDTSKFHTLEYLNESNKSGPESIDNYKHSTQQQTGGVLPTKPVERKPNGFYSKRNYKHQF